MKDKCYVENWKLIQFPTMFYITNCKEQCHYIGCCQQPKYNR